MSAASASVHEWETISMDVVIMDEILKYFPFFSPGVLKFQLTRWGAEWGGSTEFGWVGSRLRKNSWKELCPDKGKFTHTHIHIHTLTYTNYTHTHTSDNHHIHVTTQLLRYRSSWWPNSLPKGSSYRELSRLSESSIQTKIIHFSKLCHSKWFRINIEYKGFYSCNPYFIPSYKIIIWETQKNTVLTL